MGRVSLQPNYPSKIEYRFRLNKQNFEPRRSELNTEFGPNAFKINANYVFFGEGTGAGEFTNREEFSTGFSSQITRDWLVKASMRRDLQRGEPLNYGIGVEYKCDCLTVNMDFTRTFTQDRDLKPTDTVFIRFTFKNLGEIGASALK